MAIALALLSAQGVLGAFDNVWNHEWGARLPTRPGARRELVLHAIRGALYAPVFLSFGWLSWQGAFGWIFIGILAIELGVTMADFVEEDRARRLSGVERITHAVLTLNYGAFLALAAPGLVAATRAPTGFARIDHGLLGWLMATYALGSLGFALREAIAALRLGRAAAEPARQIDRPDSGRTILVTGGTGFIGRRVVRRLLERGDRVIVLTRDPARARARLGQEPEMVARLDDVPERRNLDAVINLAGAPIFGKPWTKARKRELVASRIGTTRDLVDWLAERAQRPDALVSASAVGWYGTEAERAVDESAAMGGDFPAALCNAWEREATRATALGLRVCRLRLGLVLGRDGGLLAPLAAAYRCGLGARIGSGGQWISWIHIDDAVEMIVRAADDPLFSGPINAAAPVPVRQAEFARALARTLHRPVWLRLPSWVLRPALGEMSTLLLDGQRVTPRRALEIGFAFRWHEIEAALEDLTHPRAQRRRGASVRLLDGLLT